MLECISHHVCGKIYQALLSFLFFLLVDGKSLGMRLVAIMAIARAQGYTGYLLIVAESWWKILMGNMW